MQTKIDLNCATAKPTPRTPVPAGNIYMLDDDSFRKLFEKISGKESFNNKPKKVYNYPPEKYQEQYKVLVIEYNSNNTNELFYITQNTYREFIQSRRINAMFNQPRNLKTSNEYFMFNIGGKIIYIARLAVTEPLSNNANIVNYNFLNQSKAVIGFSLDGNRENSGAVKKTFNNDTSHLNAPVIASNPKCQFYSDNKVRGVVRRVIDDAGKSIADSDKYKFLFVTSMDGASTTLLAVSNEAYRSLEEIKNFDNKAFLFHLEQSFIQTKKNVTIPVAALTPPGLSTPMEPVFIDFLIWIGDRSPIDTREELEKLLKDSRFIKFKHTDACSAPANQAA